MSTNVSRVRYRGGMGLAKLSLSRIDTTYGQNYTWADTWQGAAHGEFGVMTDVVTKNYKATSANGEIVNTPMDSREEISQYATGVVTEELFYPVPPSGYDRWTYSGHFTPWRTANTNCALMENVYAPFTATNIAAKAAIKARNNVSPTIVQGLVSLAELHKTVRLVKDLAGTLAKTGLAILRGGNPAEIKNLVLGLRRDQRGSARDIVEGVSSRYLQYRYGTRILIMEVQGVLKALNPNRRTPMRATARGNESQTAISTADKVLSNIYSGNSTFRFTSGQTISARAYVLYQADLSYQLARDFGLYDIPGSLWDIVPYSFVVDWFIPIQNWLQALTPKVGIKVLAEGVTVSNHTHVESMIISHTEPQINGSTKLYHRVGHIGLTDRYSLKTKTRTPTLNVALRLPPIDVRLDAAKCLDAIALLIQAGKQMPSRNSMRF